MKLVRRILIILSVLFLGFLIIVISNSQLLNSLVVGIVIVIILKQLGLFGSEKGYDHDHYGHYSDSDWDDGDDSNDD